MNSFQTEQTQQAIQLVEFLRQRLTSNGALKAIRFDAEHNCVVFTVELHTKVVLDVSLSVREFLTSFIPPS